jgi:CBS domain-containing protein
MQVRDVMTRHVDVIGPSTPLEEAAQKMRTLDVGSLPVCDGERLVGMLTDRDITVRATAEGYDAGLTRARDVMTEDLKYCFEDEDVRNAAEIMERAQIRRLVVIDRNKRLCGIVSLGDLAITPETRDAAEEALEEISQPAGTHR